MKGALLFIAIFALSMLVIPMIAVNYTPSTPEEAEVTVHQPVPPPDTDALTAPQKPPAQPVELPEPIVEENEPLEEESGDEYTLILGASAFRILDETTGEIHTVPAEDYVRGAVASEMPASFHPEALKAQAVAAHTYALYNHYLQQERPDPALRGADFSGDPSNMKVYATEERVREFYGPFADESWERICEAVDSVSHLVLEYDDQPIVAAYHAMSAGATENAENVWVGEAPYLAAADSEGDYLAPDYETEVAVSGESLKNVFAASYPGITFTGDQEDWIGDIQRSPSGYITSIRVGDTEMHGSDVRRVLNLRSHNFEVLPGQDGFLFIVYGHGHGVGLSQYGADFMGRQGASFEEILENYYTGATLAEVYFE